MPRKKRYTPSAEDEYGEGTLTTSETAERLGLSERRVRQLGDFLHAERDSFGRLHFPAMAVSAFALQRQTRQRQETHADRLARLERELADLETRLRHVEGFLGFVAPHGEHGPL